ncbi:MAG: alpha-L-glutamate ligase-like protein [Burkholderiaceae bacterium]
MLFPLRKRLSLALPHKLARAGVVGLNKRNADVILPHNERSRYPLVDDKVQTKDLAIKAGLAVPELYGLIRYAGDVRKLPQIIAGHKQFVVKPAQGSGGDGIIVIKDKLGDFFQKASGQLISDEQLRFHIQNALGGVFSLGGQPDSVLIEYCVQFDPVFERISYQGVPDVRIIVYHGIPVMAMVRLPTRMSDGRANLHQGAIGAGINLRSGRTLSAVWLNMVVHEHPDTREKIGDVLIPHWRRMLDIAAQTYELTGLGYQGVDIVLDKQFGPLILELNARPGLNIQIANRAGLLPRLALVDAHRASLADAGARVDFAMEAFDGH